ALHQPALSTQAGGPPGGPGDLMADGVTASRDETAKASSARKRMARKPKRAPGRWVREAKGILALALAGFGFVALGAYDPGLNSVDQSSPVGPVGDWLGAASFWAVGYAGYLFPLLLALYGVSAFVPPRIGAGWPALVGLGLLVTSVTGMLARASDTLATHPIHKGGVVGWAGSEALQRSVGTVGAWIILITLLPVGILFVTQLSYSALSRALGSQLGRLRPRAQRPLAQPGPALAGAGSLEWPAAHAEISPPQLVVKEPPRPKPGLVEKGLAWQETFDFGEG